MHKTAWKIHKCTDKQSYMFKRLFTTQNVNEVSVKSSSLPQYVDAAIAIC